MPVNTRKLTISYKFLIEVLALICATVAVANKWIEGVGFVTIVVTTVPAYFTANVLQKRLVPKEEKKNDVS